jgi:hypothetical protein
MMRLQSSSVPLAFASALACTVWACSGPDGVDHLFSDAGGTTSGGREATTGAGGIGGPSDGPGAVGGGGAAGAAAVGGFAGNGVGGATTSAGAASISGVGGVGGTVIGGSGGAAVAAVAAVTALGIRLQKVELTQAVSTPLGPDAMGGAIAPSARNAKALEKRPTLLRAHYQVAPGWQTRSIEAVLYLKDSSGTLTTLPLTKSITGDSDEASLSSTFNWQLSPTQALAGLSGHVELHESAGSLATGAVLDSPRFPKVGEADFALQAGAMDIKVTVAALTVGGVTLSVNAADVKALSDYAIARFPTQTIEFTMHAPVATTFSTFADAEEQPTFDLCSELRQTDGAAPNVYYLLLIPGSKASVDWDGSSGIPGPTQDEADDRCSMVITEKSNVVADKALTFTHELGHAQGLSHAPCGDASDPDELYPYPDAQIGVQGYDVFASELFPTQTPDIMSYCDPAWISDYNWNKLEARTRVLTSWDTRHQVVAGRSLRGLFRRAGEISWTLIRGRVGEMQVPTASTERARALDGKLAGVPLPLFVRKMTGTHGLSEVYLSLPDGADTTAYEVMMGGTSHVVSLASVRDFSR